MISVEDKIDIFEQELTAQLNEQKEKVLTEAKEPCEEKEAKADLRIKKQNQSIKERYARMTKRNTTKIIAEGQTEAKEMILATKKEIRAEFFEALVQKIDKLIQTKAYQNYFQNNLKEIKNLLKDSEEIKLYINEDEYELFKESIEEILSDFKIIRKELPEKSIGGFLVHDFDDRVSYDFSLENLINEKEQLTNYYFTQLVNGDLN